MQLQKKKFRMKSKKTAPKKQNYGHVETSCPPGATTLTVVCAAHALPDQSHVVLAPGDMEVGAHEHAVSTLLM